jgi:hypothetical protein
MRRMIMLVGVAVVMAAMMLAMAMPVFADEVRQLPNERRGGMCSFRLGEQKAETSPVISDEGFCILDTSTHP